MTSDAKLPIATYKLANIQGHFTMLRFGPHADDQEWCQADDVRPIVERAEKAEAQRDRLVEVLRDLEERNWMLSVDAIRRLIGDALAELGEGGAS